MLIDLNVNGFSGGGWAVPATDARFHSAHTLSTRHPRVWLCDVCEHAPAAVTCQADAAALCVTCDADIHSANPLAQRHHRVPVVSHHCSDDGSGGSSHHYDDPFIDFAYPKSVDSTTHRHDCDGAGADSVVPEAPAITHHSPEINCFNIDFCTSKLSSSYQNVSSASLDVGVVPVGNPSMGSEPESIIRTVPAAATTATAAAQATHLCGMEREARVMRYREKRKKRKFEKTIRYASRKAYAETRPRIKGRFAKRNGSESEGMYLGDYEYGVVPSF